MQPQFRTRGISIALRTLHLASFGILLGGHAFAIQGERLLTALILTIASGIGLMVVEVYVFGVQWLFLGKGLVILLKLAILIAIPYYWEYRLLFLLLVVAIASVGSHMPGRYRHYSFLYHRLMQPGERLRIPSLKVKVPTSAEGHQQDS